MAVRIISASAGSGKTTALTRELADMLTEVAPERVMATTFTRKAAHELQESARRVLLARGRWEEAQTLSCAWMGTVNAVCGEILRAFAFELGLSPDLEVLPEGEAAALLETSLADVLAEPPHGERARAAAWALSLDEGKRRWLQDVLDVVSLARGNGIPPDAFTECARRSVEGLGSMLDPPDPRGAATLNDELRAAVEGAEEGLTPFADSAKNTTEALALLRRVQGGLRKGRVRWAEWVRLSGLDAGKKHAALVEPVHAAAARYMAHPDLRRDISDYIEAVFHLARHGMERYRACKEKRRLVDFVDQEERVLALLEEESTRERLAERVDLLLVDEFQDTSPLQLAIFKRLAAACRHSIWVGDPKQSIYGFRGADPGLMQACVGEDVEVLEDSWRSRAGLVHTVSHVFARAFPGVPERQVVLRARRSDVAEYGEEGAPEPIAVWKLDTSQKAGDKAAIAEGVARILGEMRVVDRASGLVRLARAEDVAVLCGRNDDCLEMAGALAARGIAASVARAGLLDTLEGMVVEASLRLLLDPSDTLAASLIAFLDRAPEQAPERWLEERLVEVREEVSDDLAFDAHPRVRALRAARDRVGSASPSEALEMAMEAAELPSLCLRWGRTAQRLDNLEALRGMAADYVDLCRVRRAAATAAGLLLHMQRAAREGRDEQGDAGDAAVQVLTFHAAKGLEWPVVVLADLDRAPHGDPFGATVESSGVFDAERPLAGRWIRLWMSPFGGLKKDVPFLTRALLSPEGLAAAQRDREEEARLLYVAMTRARDHLVLAARVVKGELKTPWPDRAVGSALAALWEAVGAVDEGVVSWDVPVRVLRLGPGDVGVAAVGTERWFARAPRVERLPFEVAARSLVLGPEERLTVGETIVLRSERLTVRRTGRRDDLGSAVHAFLAADSLEDVPLTDRLALASRVLRGFGQAETVRDEDLVAAGAALRSFVRGRWGDVRWHREVPLAFREGEQEVHGIADLLLEAGDGWIVVDHKSYDGPPETWAGKSEEFLPQLEAYARGVERATGRPVVSCWLHFPLAGGMVEVRRDPSIYFGLPI